MVEVRADSRVGGWDIYYGKDMILPSTGSTGRSIADSDRNNESQDCLIANFFSIRLAFPFAAVTTS